MDNFVGEIRMFAGHNYAPEGWHYCDGTLLSKDLYQHLFSVIGSNYGGDGHTTFALPDLRGRIPVGQGTGPGLTPRALGQAGGVEGVTLSPAQVGPHSHSLTGTTSPADTPTPGPNRMLAETDPTVRPFNDANVATGVFANFGANAIGPSAPAALPHENRMPSMGIAFIIALDGVTPPA